MEEFVFPDPAVAGVLENYIEARLHTDEGENLERTRAVQKELTGTLSIPYYVIVDPETGETLGTLESATQKDKFQSFLEQGLEKL